VAEWIARVYHAGPRYRVVVDGLLDFESDGLERIEDRTAAEILTHLRRFFPKKGSPWKDPTAERVMLFELAVEFSPTEG
jgi:hypothetical protein